MGTLCTPVNTEGVERVGSYTQRSEVLFLIACLINS
jgi:hypothetical protein